MKYLLTVLLLVATGFAQKGKPTCASMMSPYKQSLVDRELSEKEIFNADVSLHICKSSLPADTVIELATLIEKQRNRIAVAKEAAEKAQEFDSLVAKYNELVTKHNELLDKNTSATVRYNKLIDEYNELARRATTMAANPPTRTIYEPIVIPSRPQSIAPIHCSAFTFGQNTSMNCY